MFQAIANILDLSSFWNGSKLVLHIFSSSHFWACDSVTAAVGVKHEQISSKLNLESVEHESIQFAVRFCNCKDMQLIPHTLDNLKQSTQLIETAATL